MVSASRSSSSNDIAIVGMALRVPGATSPEAFWKNLRDGVESIRTLTREELIAAGERPEAIDDPAYVPRAADIADMEMFDAAFFGLSPRDAAIMDPQHRHFLECTWEALENAGIRPEAQSGPIGVFAGCGMGSYFYFNVCSNRKLVEDVGLFLLRHTGNDKDFLSTRVSYTFDLRGPSINTQTACSTSLVAVHLACQSLLSGECDAAIAGGVTIEQPHRRGYRYQEGEILAPDGHCRPFDHRASGTVFGSGAGVVVLRRLADAIADGDVIHAVITASAVNNDGGQKAGYLAPSVTGQAGAIIEAHGLAGVSADTIQYVECHGTGTYLGDPIEIQALTEAFRQSTAETGFCYVGSVKSNIGHLDTAAGVVSLIKASLALKHGQIPPTLGFEKPNPVIGFEKTPFRVADRLIPWPQTSTSRRAAVNSLGVGGTNAHVILEAFDPDEDLQRSSKELNGASLLLFSARDKDSLERNIAQITAAICADDDLSLLDASFTLATARRGFQLRSVLAVADRSQLTATDRGGQQAPVHSHEVIRESSGAVFMFSGGGTQYIDMAADLYHADHEFRRHVDEGMSYVPESDRSAIGEIWFGSRMSPAERSNLFERPSRQLAAILILEVAISRMWLAKGVKPAALIGHSMGEYAAACIAGVMSFRDAVHVVLTRGRLFERIDKGAMLAVSLSLAELRKLLPDDLDIASHNGPSLCVVSGSVAALDAFQANLLEHGIDCNRIPIDIAAHCRMLDTIIADFEICMSRIALSPPTIAIMSNLTGTWLTDVEACDPMYWVQHLRATVQFGPSMAELSRDPKRVYIEVGPGRVLSSLAKAQPQIAANQVINSLPHALEDVDDRLHLLAAFGRAWAVGLKIDLSSLWVGRSARRVALPTYAFNRQRYFIDRCDGMAVGHEVPLSRQEDLRQFGFQPIWRQFYPEPVTDALSGLQCWIVFVDNAAVGHASAQRLRESEHTVITVSAGDAFSKRDALSYTICPEQGKKDYAQLLAQIFADGLRPTRILHALLVTESQSVRAGSNQFSRHQEYGFHSLLHLAQAISDWGITDPIHIDVLANGLQSIAGEALPYPEKATVCGPVQVIPKEMPGITVRLIDLEIKHNRKASVTEQLFESLRAGSRPSEPFSALLWSDLVSLPACEIIAYRGDRRWRREYRQLPLEKIDASAATIRHNGVYWLTGGFGDLSLSLARELAEQYQAKLILTGRSSLPDRSTWGLCKRLYADDDRIVRAITAIEAIEASGGTVLYFAADVTNFDEMSSIQAQVENIVGPVNGVFHTAGMIDDALIAMKSSYAIDAVMAPKVQGTLVLDRLFANRTLDFMLLFSSTSSDLAPPGQVDYVAANSFLNAYAQSRPKSESRLTTAVHWGVWAQVGMAARALGRAGTMIPTDETELEDAKGPVFHRWIKDRNSTSWLETDLEAQVCWFLNEHRLLDGTAILPGTAYIELIAQAAKEYGLPIAATIEDLNFLKPIVVKDGQVRRLRLRLIPRGQGYQVVFAADGDEGFTVHAEARLEFKTPDRPQIRESYLQFPTDSLGDGPAIPSIQEDNIRFGPRWRVLRHIENGDGEATAHLRLPDVFHADISNGYLAHPGLLDIATGFALGLTSATGRQRELWIPAGYGRVVLYEPLPHELISHASLSTLQREGEGYASFDVVLRDIVGRVVATVNRLVMKRLGPDTSFGPREVPRRTAPAHRPSAYSERNRFGAQVREGILPTQGLELVRRALGTGHPQPIISAVDFRLLLASSAIQTETNAIESEMFARAVPDASQIAPRTATERQLAGFWTQLLGIETIGVHENFFDIGGHSLIAVRLFRQIKQTFEIDLPMSVLFEAPTIAQCATLIDQDRASVDDVALADAQPPQSTRDIAHLHLVTMSGGQGASGHPIFLCAGMFGNVLNLRQMALHLGQERPVYGLQARGLFGGQSPHETFEEMATDYLKEIKTVQPYGPYYLCGFSGGGLVAMEMAQQLQAQGETVAQVIMLDTPLPTDIKLSMFDRLHMKYQDVRRDCGAFVKNWVQGHIRWYREKSARRKSAQQQHAPEHFHSAEIEAAFYRALARYEVQPYSGNLMLIRPKLDVIYTLRGGRQLQGGRKLAADDNGWRRFSGNLIISEVPGNHDTMVLEPNVRVLVDRIKHRLRSCESDGLFNHSQQAAE